MKCKKCGHITDIFETDFETKPIFGSNFESEPKIFGSETLEDFNKDFNCKETTPETTNALDEEIEVRMEAGEKPFETTEKWEEELRKESKIFVKEHGLIKSNASSKVNWELGFFQCIEEFILPFIRQTRQEAKQKALDIIAEGSGWEESYDIYAKKLNLPTRYSK